MCVQVLPVSAKRKSTDSTGTKVKDARGAEHIAVSGRLRESSSGVQVFSFFCFISSALDKETHSKEDSICVIVISRAT